MTKYEILNNLNNYTAEEIAQAIRDGIVNLYELKTESRGAFTPILKMKVKEALCNSNGTGTNTNGSEPEGNYNTADATQDVQNSLNSNVVMSNEVQRTEMYPHSIQDNNVMQSTGTNQSTIQPDTLSQDNGNSVFTQTEQIQNYEQQNIPNTVNQENTLQQALDLQGQDLQNQPQEFQQPLQQPQELQQPLQQPQDFQQPLQQPQSPQQQYQQQPYQQQPYQQQPYQQQPYQQQPYQQQPYQQQPYQQQPYQQQPYQQQPYQQQPYQQQPYQQQPYQQQPYQQQPYQQQPYQQQPYQQRMDSVDSNKPLPVDNDVFCKYPGGIDNRGMFLRPFSFKGRIRRLEYFISCIILTIVSYIPYIVLMTTNSLESFMAVALVLVIPYMWFSIAANIKRCHDLGHNGWFSLIPFYGIILLFAEGDIESNLYGNNPKDLI